jgi:hypothetical protein
MPHTIKLKASFDNGEGSISVPESFKNCYPLLKADILKDWIYDLEEEYKKARQEMREEWSKARAKRRAQTSKPTEGK